MFTINVNCICCEKGRDKTVFLLKISGVEVAPCLLQKIFGVEVTPSVTSVVSSEQFWCKICQIRRLCEPCSYKFTVKPCLMTIPLIDHVLLTQIYFYFL